MALYTVRQLDWDNNASLDIHSSPGVDGHYIVKKTDIGYRVDFMDMQIPFEYSSTTIGYGTLDECKAASNEHNENRVYVEYLALA